MRRLLLVLAVSLLLPAAAAPAAEARGCRSSDLRYPFEPGGPKHFGVHKLRVTGAGCGIARRVARTWMREFEAELDKGRVRLPEEALGFRFVSLPPNEAQTYRLRGRREGATIRFSYRVPNG